MNWFRSNRKHGARLALLALALQLGLSFGHFHSVVAQASPVVQSGQPPSDLSGGVLAPDGDGQSDWRLPSDHDSGQPPTDACPICAVMALANTVLLATPPVLLLPHAVELLYLTTDAEFVHLGAIRVAFQPRAPPVI